MMQDLNKTIQGYAPARIPGLASELRTERTNGESPHLGLTVRGHIVLLANHEYDSSKTGFSDPQHPHHQPSQRP